MRKPRNRTNVINFLIFAALALLVGGTSIGAAQPKTDADISAYQTLKSSDRPLSRDAVRDLVARLDDAQVRDLLLSRLDATDRAAQQHNAVDIGGAINRIQRNADRIRDQLSAMFAAVVELPGVFPDALERLRDGRPYRFFAFLLLGFAAMLAVGHAVEWLFWRAISGYRQKIIEAQPESVITRFCYLVARFGLDLASIGVFLAAAIGTFFVFYQGHEMTRQTVMTYLAAIAAIRIYATFSRFLLAPKVPALRLVQMTDPQTVFLHRQNLIIAVIAAIGFFTCSLIEALGIVGPVHELMVVLVAAVMIGWIIWTIWASREAISADLRGPPELASRGRRVFADVWPRVTAIYVFLLFILINLIELSGGSVSYYASFGSLLTVLFVPHFDALIERAARSTQTYANEEGRLSLQLQAVVLRAMRIVLFIVAVLFLARIWGVDFFSLAEASFGARIAGALLDIGLTMLVAYVLWEITRIAIDRRLAEEREDESETEVEAGDIGGTGQSRLSTLLPLVKRAIQITIAVIAVMVFLSAMGVNIGPLLAGAGVVGLAIGFGAQTLVRDIVSGVFFLMDDAFRVGEYIDVGTVKGTVEKISIRSLRLRHHKGALHTIPFGEIRHLTNHSRDWVIMKLDFRVPFDTDINKVRKIFKQIGLELLEHPDLGPDFIQPFKSQGVYTTDDSALVIRGKFMAHPGRQFLIRREVYSAVQHAFTENGISFASRQVTVNVPVGAELTEEQKLAVETAAASATGTPPPGMAPTPETAR